jgi:non-ribosomal peptide synthetase component F
MTDPLRAAEEALNRASGLISHGSVADNVRCTQADALIREALAAIRAARAAVPADREALAQRLEKARNDARAWAESYTPAADYRPHRWWQEFADIFNAAAAVVRQPASSEK